MLKKRQSARMLVRLPNPQKEWLTRVAEHNCTSINSEVIRCVRERMEGERATASLAKTKLRGVAAAAE
ncbi:Arc family DNA-binding protein [Bradyrhizobium sp. 6(2017)]|uniref:Arc family DNA-binding protein n=1 Tax=Bradyrhizobium sp. 6(2017) TaxID=1197460 RepID=UPI0013E201C3|nr:Arc family DNA-binding protein [Bradyrhizobium sp. 6(2017)]QIG97521.1 Arc family DNA-binding protein [Bradyrhizobium sp. 6(2017)]